MSVDDEVKVNVSNALLIDGWMSKQELTWLAQQARKIVSGRVVEIGTYLGRSARVITDNLGQGSYLVCVDPYTNFKDSVININDESPLYNGDEIYRQAQLNVPRAVFIRMTSLDAVERFSDHTIDMVFIDGEHTYESVKQDINAWYPKVKPGGTLCGHDYTTYNDVERAVKDSFPFEWLTFPVESIWSVTRPGGEQT